MATPIQPVEVRVNRARGGKLNSDTDILELREGDYTDRVNVEFNADGQLFSDTPALGNRFVCDLGEQQVQSQQTRIYIDGFFDSLSIEFYNINPNGRNVGQLKQTVNGISLEQTLQGMKGAIVDCFVSLNYYSVTYENDFSSKPYIDVTINTLADYILVITDNKGNVLRNDDIKEAISLTGAGKFIEIGSKDLLGTTWLFSTTQDKEQFERENALMAIYTNPAIDGGQVTIFFPNHGLENNENVTVANATGIGESANGVWVANVIDENNFGLILSNGAPFSTTPTQYGGVIYKDTFGLGQIGVQQYNGDTDSYTYTKILASKRFNFRTMYQIDADAVLNNNGYLLKFTDNYNYPRTFSYRNEFVENGALEPLNTDGYYTYETLTDEIKNIINYSSAIVKFEEQVQSGGSLPPANWRYAVRFITDTNAPTEVSFMSDPIPVFPVAYGDDPNVRIYGASIGVTTTPKINRVRVTEITPGIFKYVELIAYNYASSSVNSVVVNSFIIRKELLQPDQVEIVLEHNGNEPDIVFFDTTLSTAVRPDIIRAGSNRFCENRLVYGDISTSTQIDIRPWVDTFKYSIKRKPIYGSFGAEAFYEFYDPQNTQFAGYQKWEWYRFYVSAELKSGKINDTVFAFDVRFVTKKDYDPNEFIETNKSDRRDFVGDEFTAYADGSDSEVNQGRDIYQYFLELNNINWEYRIDGILVSELFKSVKVMRAERVKEVIASGAFIGSVNLPTGGLTDYRQAAREGNNYFFPMALDSPGAGGGTSIDPMDTVRANPFFGSFYSPDIIFGATEYQWQSSDVLINFGMNNIASNQSSSIGGGVVNWWGISGYENFATQAQQIEILESKFIPAQGAAVFGTTPYFKFTPYYSGTYLYDGPTFRLNDDIQNVSPTANHGVFQALLFRRKSDKYGDVDAVGNIVVFTGSTILAGDSQGEVFGGDVFNQQTQFKHVTRTGEAPSNRSAQGFNIISSNIVNTNLRAYDPLNPNLAFPVNPTTFGSWLATPTPQAFNKNTGYSIFNQVQAATVYDPDGNDIGNYITRKYYSQLNPNNANTDKYREFLPLDFQDNPNSFGRITHLEVVNGELFTLQQRGFTREFFNTTGRLQTAEDGDVLIGTGDVLSRKGLRLTMLGTNQKWSVCKGYSSSGKETIIWVNDEYGVVIRFGADGTVNLSDRAMMSTFFRERMQFVIGKDTPADNEGITSVWDNIGKNFIITQRAWKKTAQWFDDVNYPIGFAVTQGQILGISQIYVAIQANEGVSPTSEQGENFWEKIELSNLNYYNVYTIAFNEQKNSFTHRYTFYPRIYHTLNNRYFSPSPYDTESNLVFRHRDKDSGEIVFYNRENEGFTEYVVNYMSSIVKKFIAHAQSALLKPIRVEFESQFISENGIDDRKTFVTREDFTMRENKAFSTIKNNLDEQGRNDQQTAPIRGSWLKLRTFFSANEKQKINDTSVVIRTGQRNVENP